MKIKNIDNKKIKNISDYVANHFGFEHIDSPAIAYSSTEEKLVTAERTRVAYYYKKNDLEKRKNLPKFYFYNKPILTPKNFKNKNTFGLDIYNVENPIAEGLLVTTIYNILKEEKYNNFIFEINAFGDKESIRKFSKELIAFYKQKDIYNKLTHVEKSKIPKDPISLLSSKKDFMIEINKEAPQSIAFLSGNSRDFFGSVIEYFDSLNIPYRINSNLMDVEKTFKDFIFRVLEDSDNDQSDILAFGGRYTELSQVESGKKTTIASGASLSFKKTTKKIVFEKAKTNFHLLKISEGATKSFLNIVSLFLELKHPVSFYPNNEKITLQLDEAVEDNADYSLILGQKEYLEKNILIRTMKNKSQVTVEQKDLRDYLKKTFKI